MPIRSKNLIVFFPGYTGLPKSKFNPLLRKFRRDGFSTYSVKYNLFGRGDISELAVEASKQIDKLNLAAYDTVTFIGHSMGGLVARKLACLGSSTPDHLVTLGTPHNGVQGVKTPFWRIGGHSVGQMLPGSKWSKYCGYPDTPTLAITGGWDILVENGSISPKSTCTDPWYDKFITNINIPRTSHLGLLCNYRTYGEIYSWLVYEQLNTLHPNKVSLASTFQNF